MPEPNAAQASLVFLGIVDFARKPVAEQASLRERLDAAVARSIASATTAGRFASCALFRAARTAKPAPRRPAIARPARRSGRRRGAALEAAAASPSPAGLSNA